MGAKKFAKRWLKKMAKVWKSDEENERNCGNVARKTNAKKEQWERGFFEINRN